MDWLIQALSALREVRDGAASRTKGTSLDDNRPLFTESDPDLNLTIAPIGPACPPARKKARRSRSAKPRGGARSTPDGPKRISVKRLDRDAVEVVRRLRRFKHTAYMVGGCVRDLLVDLPPKDFDVSTSARPEEIKKIFRNSRIIGRRFKLAHIYFRGGKIIETATFRGNAGADEGDGSQDLLITRDNVWGTEQEDALRRDFTINGLMYDVESGAIIDHIGGMADIEAQTVRTIGEADIRVREDPVRILRAIRFSAKLGFTIEPGLLEAMTAHRREIARCPQARVLEESFKLLRTGYAERSVQLLDETGVLGVILSEMGDPRKPHAGVTVFDYLRALDLVVRNQGEVSDAVVLSAVLLGPLEGVLEGVEPKAYTQALTAELGKATERLGTTRRIRERMRQIFSAQKQFRSRGGRKPRRRVSPGVMLRRSFFVDALNLAEIWSIANGDQDKDIIDTWREHARNSDHVVEDAPPPPARRRRRRRRGGQSPAW